MQEYSEKFGFEKNLQSKTQLHEATERLRETKLDPLILDQINSTGLGADLVLEAHLDENDEVTLYNLMQYLNVQQSGFKFIESMASIFDQVEILEHCGEFYKFRVPKGDKTIGFLFGTIEDNKAEFSISEYSVSQTTLEQIFQNFANLNTMDKARFAFSKN